MDRAIGLLEVLAAARGAMGADAFANKLGLLPSRVPGYVADRDERFNIDGNQVVRYDRQSRQVTLHLDLLKSLRPPRLLSRRERSIQRSQRYIES